MPVVVHNEFRVDGPSDNNEAFTNVAALLFEFGGNVRHAFEGVPKLWMVVGQQHIGRSGVLNLDTLQTDDWSTLRGTSSIIE